MNDTNLTNHEEMKQLVINQYNRASKVMSDLADDFAKDLISNWEKAGGCKRCEGTQSVLTWSTLDGSSYDEFGRCPDCTEESIKVGKKPGVWGPRGTDGCYSLTNLELAKKEFPLGMKDVVEQYEIASSNYAQCVTAQLNRGEYIIVVKGRKVPVGDHGVIVGFSNNQWSAKLGFVNADGKVQWTAVSNVERCLGMDGETRRQALEAFCKSENEYRAKKGLKPKQHDVVAMMMQMV